MYEKFIKYFSNIYGEGVDIAVDIDVEDAIWDGILFGNNECYDIYGFYQFFVSNDGDLYRCYYDDALENIDFEKPIFSKWDNSYFDLD